VVVEEVQALLGDGEDVVRVEVARQPLAAERAQRDLQLAASPILGFARTGGAPTEGAAVGVGDVVVRARDDRGDVRGDRLGAGEAPLSMYGEGAGVRLSPYFCYAALQISNTSMI